MSSEFGRKWLKSIKLAFLRMGLKEWRNVHCDGVKIRVDSYNTRQKLRRKMKVSKDHVGEENAEEKHIHFSEFKTQGLCASFFTHPA